MINIPLFEDFVNRLNEASDAWISLPTGDWRTEYDIPTKIQKELTLVVQDKLKTKNIKITKENAEKDPKVMEEVKKMFFDHIYSYTTKRESTVIKAWQLSDGSIAVASYPAWGNELEDSDCMIWVVDKA